MTLDLMLPDQDGVSLIRELRQAAETLQLPIVVVSARASEGRDELNGGALGVIDWLVKPIDQERLTRAVQRAVHYVLKCRNPLDKGFAYQHHVEAVLKDARCTPRSF